MTFGLRNAAQTFQRFIEEVTRDPPFLFVYIDDILRVSANDREHFHHLEILFKRFHDYGLVINPTKSNFGLTEVKFLGHTVNRNGITPLKDKVNAILSIEFPTTIKSLRRFLGTINFYKKFIKQAAEILALLNSLQEGAKVKNSQRIECTKQFQLSFNKAKQALTQTTLLVHPNTNTQWEIFTVASEHGIGMSYSNMSTTLSNH
uniref:RNA-directed DNA polymerase n=1 Tax=Bactrocera latifrons TaxID=174628 RepID=A0A0K8W069_BACLA